MNVCRVLRDYFNYDVRYVMNVTDVDDKIVLRAHEQRAKEVLRVAEPFREYSDEINHLAKQLEDFIQSGGKDLKAIDDICRMICERLPANQVSNDMGALGDDWDPKKAARSVAQEYEDEFVKDMWRLNVETPDVMPRVSEHMETIVSFIESIVERGFGYQVGTSVYFDVEAFDACDKHAYGKLRPNAKSMQEEAMEGEGVLGESQAREKKSKSDFALWKGSKEGEPAWDSPWGPGRPGWHIECSAMCSSFLGSRVEMNAGGSDLEFPHHENQVAQAEAYWGTPSWASSFVHAGHLHISGLKMSKSLKNFVTIDAALKKHSWRELRMLFLLSQWSKPMEITPLEDGTIRQMEMPKAFLSTFDNFMDNCNFFLRDGAYSPSDPQVWTSHEHTLERALSEKRSSVHNALADNVQTPLALSELRDLVHSANNYMNAKKAEGDNLSKMLLRCCQQFVTRILSVFGLIGEGLKESKSGTEAELRPYIDALCHFRDKVRAKAKEFGAKDLLQETDWLRDEELPRLGVRLDDIGSASKWKLCDPEELKREKAEEEEARRAKEEAARKRRKDEERKRREKEDEARIPPSEYFKLGRHRGNFSAFDEQGIPTHDHDGNTLSNSRRKKLEKEFQSHCQKHEKQLEVDRHRAQE